MCSFRMIPMKTLYVYTAEGVEQRISQNHKTNVRSTYEKRNFIILFRQIL